MNPVHVDVPVVKEIEYATSSNFGCGSDAGA